MYLRNKNDAFILLLLTLLTSCSLDDGISNVPTNDIIVYEEGNTKIILLDVKDDRCPSDVLCVWQGNAEVFLRIDKNGQSENFILNTAGYINASLNFPKSAIVLDTEIELLTLNPYPVTTIEYELDEYILTLEVIE